VSCCTLLRRMCDAFAQCEAKHQCCRGRGNQQALSFTKTDLAVEGRAIWVPILCGFAGEGQSAGPRDRRRPLRHGHGHGAIPTGSPGPGHFSRAAPGRGFGGDRPPIPVQILRSPMGTAGSSDLATLCDSDRKPRPPARRRGRGWHKALSAPARRQAESAAPSRWLLALA
jgi:hypothetical protein